MIQPVLDEHGQSSSEDQDESEADFFQAKNRRSSDCTLKSFLHSPVEKLCEYTRWPLLCKLFIEPNTPLPANR
jgi:hypothetical protein